MIAHNGLVLHDDLVPHKCMASLILKVPCKVNATMLADIQSVYGCWFAELVCMVGRDV